MGRRVRRKVLKKDGKGVNKRCEDGPREGREEKNGRRVDEGYEERRKRRKRSKTKINDKKNERVQRKRERRRKIKKGRKGLKER